MLGSGTTLNDRYRLTSRLGGGGMGEVWRADDSVLGRVVAVKVLTPALTGNETFAQRFQNEARAMATLRHPGVVDVYDYGTAMVGERAISYLVMEFVEGRSLDQLLRRASLPVDETMRLVAEVADALAAAHAQGIVHRDVKPGNLMIRPDGSVALTDFGIAHSVSAGQLTATGAMLCSAGYCAPEMATASDVTPAVDVYALGVVAYECLTGHLPFDGDTPVQIIFKHLHNPPPPLPADVPPGPRAVVTRALEKSPDRRWESAADMGAAARRAIADPGAAPSPRRRRALTGALTVAASVLATAAVVGTLWLRPATPEERTSLFEPDTAEVVPRPPQQEQIKDRSVLPPAKTSSAKPRPTRTSPTPPGPEEPTPTPSVTPTVEPTPTAEPTPTPQPSDPGPQEPTGEPPASPGELQCVRSPCP
ncbi:serine/threonine protein kinase [Nonomuraea sp. NBC_01738]|uniref:serine/threonine-protein kinase n=1 Tax=Nonomuraea sp. NBC_01738 TaxID=2976003 RepID=UPI002E0DEFF9|nr:serine/threonine protein kinase [Nonomuraea sp. NBC_01738]